MTTANYSGAKIVSKNYNITKGGKVFNIAVEADINIQQNSECSHDVHCFTTGPGSTSFQSSRKITLIIGKKNFFNFFNISWGEVLKEH